jgi:hypothetical protein
MCTQATCLLPDFSDSCENGVGIRVRIQRWSVEIGSRRSCGGMRWKHGNDKRIFSQNTSQIIDIYQSMLLGQISI